MSKAKMFNEVLIEAKESLTGLARAEIMLMRPLKYVQGCSTTFSPSMPLFTVGNTDYTQVPQVQN